MALVKDEEKVEESKLVVDDDSVPDQGKPEDETLEGGDEDKTDEKENGDADDECEDEVDGINTCCRTIPIIIAMIADEIKAMEIGDLDEDEDGDDEDDDDEEVEKEIDIFKIPEPLTAPKEPLRNNDRPPASHPAKPSCHYDSPALPAPSSCCGYKGAWGPGPLSGYRGIGCPGFFPFAMPSFGFPIVVMPAFSCMNMYMPGMPQVCGGPGPAFYPGGHDSHHHHQGNHHHDDHYHNDPHHHHHHHHGEHQHFDGDRRSCPSEKEHHHHHGDYQHFDRDHRSCTSEEDRECQELDACCLPFQDYEKADEGNDDDTKSVEDLLEEYLEDIDEKTELIHEILDECEAMDLVVNVHGFQMEEIHVTACGSTVTVKGDHQYSEATWVRVRNFSECYEIPEEFDIERTTATKSGDTLCIRIPHVDGE